MAFSPRWTETAASTFRELQTEANAALQRRVRNNISKSTRAEGLFKQVEKCVRLLLDDPKHPGLKTHPYHSIPNPYDPGKKVFEAYAQNRTPGAYRLFWCYGPNAGEITILAITPHP